MVVNQSPIDSYENQLRMKMILWFFSHILVCHSELVVNTTNLKGDLWLNPFPHNDTF